MEKEDKATVIRRWIDPEERITVDFEDEKDLNAVVTGCTTESVALALETSVPHLRQEVMMPLSDVEIGEDRARYTRDPDKPLQYGRLRLTIRHKRPQMV
jgi:hypothetical protein